jgi:acyl-coenzyme A thioesterase PaaI-like protein
VTSGPGATAAGLARWKEWEESLGGPRLISYRYLGCRSIALDAHHAEGRMRLRRDMRAPVGLRAAPLAIALLDTAGINVDALAQVAPTRIDLDLFESAEDVHEVRIVGRVLRAGRTQLFTEGQIEDLGRPGRVVGYGTTSWAVSGPAPDPFRYDEPGPGFPDDGDLPPLPAVFEAQPRAGGGYEIPAVSRRIGTNTLHQGPIQVAMEAAAEEALADHAGDGSWRLERSGVTIAAPGRTGPFRATAELLARATDGVAVRAQLVDAGADRLVASALFRWQRA